MPLKCIVVTRDILPAIRASVAEELNAKYGFRQKEIAKSLGVVQVAISKYINRRYTEKIRKIKDFITVNKLNIDIVHAIVEKHEREDVKKLIETLCTNEKLLAISQTI
jgi:predicted transcriptional regulator